VAIAALGRAGAAGGRAPALLDAALADLSRVFYHAADPRPRASVRDELAFAERYLRLQALRFDDRLAYRIDAAEGCLGREVPRLALFPLLERAVAESLELSEGPAFIEVRASGDSRGGCSLGVARGRSQGGPLVEVGSLRARRTRPETC